MLARIAIRIAGIVLSTAIPPIPAGDIPNGLFILSTVPP